MVGGTAQRFAVASIDEDRGAPRSAACLDIAPAIANHEAGLQVDIVPASSLEQQARHGLAARTLIRINMRTDENIIQPHRTSQPTMHCVKFALRQLTGSNIRLIRR